MLGCAAMAVVHYIVCHEGLALPDFSAIAEVLPSASHEDPGYMSGSRHLQRESLGLRRRLIQKVTEQQRRKC